MEYRRRRVSSALDDIEIGEAINKVNQKNINIIRLSAFEYYACIFRKYIKLICYYGYDKEEDD